MSASRDRGGVWKKGHKEGFSEEGKVKMHGRGGQGRLKG